MIRFSDDHGFGSTVPWDTFRYIQALKSRGEKSVSLNVYNRQGEYRFADLLLPLEENEKQSVTASPVASPVVKVPITPAAKAARPVVEATTAPAAKPLSPVNAPVPPETAQGLQFRQAFQALQAVQPSVEKPPSPVNAPVPSETAEGIQFPQAFQGFQALQAVQPSVRPAVPDKASPAPTAKPRKARPETIDRPGTIFAMTQLIDINTATKEELRALKGIGDIRAANIIKNRPYWGKDELVQKNIIPPAVYAGIKDKIIAK